MPDFVHDERHRFSYELRPDEELDTALRAVAVSLEVGGLLVPGATSAPRFHPHLTLCRAATANDEALVAVAAATTPDVSFDAAGVFGEGRIIWVAATDPAPSHVARAAALEHLDPALVDPLVASRAWTPHVTIAYAVPREHQAAAIEAVRAALPITGRWRDVQCWDLDVRPTSLVARAMMS